MGKKQKEAVQNAVTDLMKAAEGAIKDTSSKMKAPTIKSLEDLKDHYQTVDVRIRKRDMKTGKFALLLALDRQSPADLEERGLDDICKDQAGGGEYQVLIKDPNVRGWTNAMKFEGIHVSGIGYDTAKNDRIGLGGPATMGGLGGGLPTAASFAPPQYGFQKDNGMKDVMKQQMEQSVGMNDRIMMMMNNANNQNMQMMQGFLAMMAGNQNKSSDDSDVKVLKERIEQMERERKQDERFGQLAKELAETKQQLLIASAAPKSGDSDFGKMVLALLTGQQNNQHQATNQYLELVKEVMQKPSEDEKISNLTGTMIRSFQGQMDLVSSAMRNGLLGNSGPEHPVAQIVSQALEGLTQVATVAFENKGHREEEEGGYDIPPVAMSAMPAYEDTQPDAPMGHLLPPQGEVAPPEAVMPTPEPAVEPEAAPQVREEDILLSDADLNRISRDTALSEIVAKIQNGVPIQEPTARIYAHARSNNDIAIRWLQYPDVISRQVLTHFGMDHHIEGLTRNIIEFMVFLSKDGNPNDWSIATGYKPIKVPSTTGPLNSELLPADQPEFGVTKGVPRQGEEYDSAHPTSQAPPQNIATADEIQPLIVEESPKVEPADVPEPPQTVPENDRQPEPAQLSV